MAIQVNGTQVIGNSRELTNIASIDSTTKSAIEAAGIGGGSIAWDPTSTPDVTLTSSGTWTKPGSLASTTWIFVYMVGGGGSGRSDQTWTNGGGGGGAHIFSGLASEFPSSIAFTVGAGGVPNNNGTATSCTISGLLYEAQGGSHNASSGTGRGGNGTSAVNYGGSDPFVAYPPREESKEDADNYIAGGTSRWNNTGYSSVFGAGAGGSAYSTPIQAPGTSTYAGNGGASVQTGNASNGGYPGGGGGGTRDESSSAGNGGNGNVRIWYIEAT